MDMRIGKHHGLIKYTDTKAKCRHLKKFSCKGTFRLCLSEFIDWRYSQSQSCWYFRLSFVNCCPSNLLSGSSLPLPPSVNIGGFIKGILRGVRCTKSLRVLFLHRRPPSWTTLVLYSRAVLIFNEPALSIYTYTVCKGGGRGTGFRASGDKHLPQSPFTGHFFR